MDMDRAYNNVDFIEDGAAYPDRWLDEARAFRETEAAIGRARLNVPYGDHAREKFDLFHPAGPAEGLVVFVHGGYWLKFDRGYWSHFAAGLTAKGWAVAMPSYVLAPEAPVPDITAAIARSIEAAATFIAGPIVLTGHSAGGHLVARMGDAKAPLSAENRARLARIVPISPVSDLRPLLDTAMKEPLGLTDDIAHAESPVLAPAPEVPVTVWVGAEERPVFLDQARWLAEGWDAQHRIAPGRHHFDVIDLLQDADGPMVADLVGGLAPR